MLVLIIFRTHFIYVYAALCMMNKKYDSDTLTPLNICLIFDSLLTWDQIAAETKYAKEFTWMKIYIKISSFFFLPSQSFTTGFSSEWIMMHQCQLQKSLTKTASKYQIDVSWINIPNFNFFLSPTPSNTVLILKSKKIPVQKQNKKNLLMLYKLFTW